MGSVLLLIFTSKPSTYCHYGGCKEVILGENDRLRAVEIASMHNPADFAQQEVGRMHCLKDLKSNITETYRPYFERSNKKIVLMDIALHANIGDIILWVAAVKLITNFGISPKLVCYQTQKSYKDRIDNTFAKCNYTNVVDNSKGGGLIFLHAGGNWGDLYRYQILGCM